MKPSKDQILRLKGIDFLRGIAVILVLLRHHWLFDLTQRIGWIGVDLFFVLSGFLVSGLLFSEFKNTGTIKPLYFLIRRGFKIYPLFYLSILATIIIVLLSNERLLNYKNLNYKGIIIQFLSEIFFLQNYLGSFWEHHWSLAVEEHFYIFLTIVIYILCRKKELTSQTVFYLIALYIFLGCLGLRILSSLFFPEQSNFSETHLRIDSLFFGVTISYLYHFNNLLLKKFFHKYKMLLVLLSFLAVVLMPLVYPLESLFIKTVGFTILYIGFGCILIIFLFSQKIASLSKHSSVAFLYEIVCQVGFYSYSIYLLHMYIIKFVTGNEFLLDSPLSRKLSFSALASFLIFFFSSIAAGIVLSHLVEKPFLNLRDRFFPRKAKINTFESA